MLKHKKDKDKKKSAPSRDAREETTTANPQGITARGNALRKIVLLALLATLVPVMLGFAYLLMLREPAQQADQIDRVASSFALQQATNVDHLYQRLRTRILKAAQSPLALSAIASESEDDLAAVEKAMLDYFPEVVSLRIISIGDLGTADFSKGSRGLRNHIEVDLVRRASEGKKIAPEAYKIEKQWLTSMAARITHPSFEDRHAVVIATLDNDQISAQLQSLDSAAGRFALEQSFDSGTGAERVDVIAASGRGSPGPYTRHAEVPDTPWRVSFTPSDALLKELEISRRPLLIVFGLIVTGAIVSALIVLRLFPRALAARIDSVISAAERKTPLALDIPELVTIAKQLRRATLRVLRHSSATPSEIPRPDVETLAADAFDMANPLFQSKAILDQEDESLELDLDLTADAPSPAAPAAPGRKLPGHVFRAYDIRGDAQTDLTDDMIAKVGGAIGTLAGEMGEQTLIVGCDGRLSSPRIKSALMRSLMETGRDVVDIGLVPTPLLYFATRHLACRSGVMITGSHNPAEHNGLKIVLKQQTIAAGGIQQIRSLAESGEFSEGNGRLTQENITPAYLDAVLQDIAIAVPLKIVIDAGNGATSEIAPRLFEELGCEVVRLYCDIDGRFPNHPPDTSDESNLTALVRVVQEERADFGVAYDGDGDRLAVVTANGTIVRSDVLMMLYAQDVVSRNPGADVVFDVKCSRNLSKVITRYGGRPVLWKTGHAFMKEKMRQTGALLGGEFSGHIFFGERWYGFDDGMYATGRLAEILSTHGDSLDESIARLPASINTPEILIPVPDDYKFELMEKIIRNADFSSGRVNTLDGIRVDFNSGWGLVRASNTVPALTARFEADTESDLAAIKDEFRAQIALIDPDIELNF